MRAIFSLATLNYLNYELRFNESSVIVIPKVSLLETVWFLSEIVVKRISIASKNSQIRIYNLIL